MIQEFSTPRIGTVFQEKTGKLFDFNVGSILVLRGWPHWAFYFPGGRKGLG